MEQNQTSILVINGGSSSIRFAVYESGEELALLSHGEMEGIGSAKAKFSFSADASDQKGSLDLDSPGYDAASIFLIGWLQKNMDFHSIRAIGHRIVHGMKHTEPERITPDLLHELKTFIAYDPEHLPGEIKLIELFGSHYPVLPQVACFDTSFHASMPQVAKLLAIPRRYQAMGIRRYGFHGLSYAFLLEELEHIAGTQMAKGKIILAHLGNGASLAAVKNGKSVDTSMGFTPASGLPMSTRTGDLDPGVASYLMQAENLTPQAFDHLVNHGSGLLGLSGTSSDMRKLMEQETTDVHAAEAVEFFCYQTRKWIGSFAAALEGLDALVFAGGIGENAAEVRRRICSGLQFLGIEIDAARNEMNDTIISINGSKVKVYVIKTDEALMIARLVRTVLNAQ